MDGFSDLNLFALVARHRNLAAAARELGVTQRWPRLFGQSSEIFKWNVRGSHAANLIAGSVAKYASSGVRSSRLE